jgi:hypothetical protein
MWFLVEPTDTHVCIACGSAYSIKSLAATDNYKTVAARSRQVTGWVAGDARR